jgi:sulfatase maturation enzyme AslB (radical SAM superfamily)
MYSINDIKFLHIELTTRCNARCPMCMRNYRGFDFNSGYPLTELSLADIQQIFPPKFLRQISFVNFNGNLGDFSNAKDAIEIVNYFLNNIAGRIQIETNGSTNKSEWWAQLANPRVSILFAIDGLEDTHSLYRQDTNWNKIIKNAQAVIKNGGRAIWKFIPFEHNKHQINQCQKLAQELGFFDFILYDQGRNESPVYTRKGEFSHWIGTDGWPGGAPNIHEAVQNHISWFDPNRNMNLDINESANINCAAIKANELYIAADGSIYPCCYVGFYPETMSQPGNGQIKPLVKQNNALKYNLETCIEWFNELEKQWNLPNIKSGKPFICLQNCSACPSPNAQ